MTAKSSRRAQWIESLFPQKRIFIKNRADEVRYLTLSSRMQAGIAVAAIVCLSWIVVATSALLIGWMSADSATRQALVLREAYEARIATVSAERDSRMREAAAVQERFQLALAEISRNQSDMMALQEERRELVAALEAMRGKLSGAIDHRDSARAEASDLASRMAEVTSSYADVEGHEAELTHTLATISETLADAVVDRDATRARLAEIEEELAAIEFRERVNADRQERIFSQLEDAVLITLDPLEELLSRSGKDVDALLDQVRRQYSGEGGPMIPAAIPLRADADPIYDRFRLLMEQFDRAHLMQVAAGKMPLAMPVKRSVRYTSGFGRRIDPITRRGRAHNGQDLAGPRGTPILAAGDGYVSFAGTQSGYGKVVKIRHSFGFETLYAHLNSIKVKRGENVSAGDVIGGMGNTGRSTGTHLHYEIRIDGKPVNPMPYMKAARNVF